MPESPTHDSFQVEIEAMGAGGVGVGRHGRRTVYLPFTIPGETVIARALETADTFIRAEGITLVDSSADRVAPRCPHFGIGRCGKCQWQHIDYPAQVLIKQDVFTEELERGGLKNPPVRPIIASPKAWGYNHHMIFTVGGDRTPIPNGVDEDGEPVFLPNPSLFLGFPSLDDGGLIPITECQILHPDLLDLYEQLDLDLTGLRRVKMQIGSDGATMLILTALESTAPQVETELRVSVNLILPDNEPMNLIGESHTRFKVHGHEFRVTAGSFFRANVDQVPALVDTVLNLLEPHHEDAVLDLYAGVGVFSAFIAPHVDLVSMVESYPPAVTDADKNLERFGNVDVFEGGVDSVLNALDEQYTAAVIDPPAQGISPDALSALTELGVERAVLIVDDARALAKEVKKFERAGYALRAIQPIDLAPQTWYVDAVALFTRT